MNTPKLLLAIALLFSTVAFAQDKESEYKVGDVAPAFTGIDQDGNTISSAELLKKGPVVIFFYRGEWCPYCNRQIMQLQDSLQLVLNKGASVVAITPSAAEGIDKIVSKTKATFSIIHDKDYKIMMDYGVAFEVSTGTKIKYKLGGINLKKENGNDGNILPVPATYVIGTDGKIKYVYYNVNYKERATVKSILLAL